MNDIRESNGKKRSDLIGRSGVLQRQIKVVDAKEIIINGFSYIDNQVEDNIGKFIESS